MYHGINLTMKEKTDSRANGIDTDSVADDYPTDDTIHGFPWYGIDVYRTEVPDGLAAKVHFDKEKCICCCL